MPLSMTPGSSIIASPDFDADIAFAESGARISGAEDYPTSMAAHGRPPERLPLLMTDLVRRRVAGSLEIPRLTVSP
jgi:hypothetical protein